MLKKTIEKSLNSLTLSSLACCRQILGFLKETRGKIEIAIVKALNQNIKVARLLLPMSTLLILENKSNNNWKSNKT